MFLLFLKLIKPLVVQEVDTIKTIIQYRIRDFGIINHRDTESTEFHGDFSVVLSVLCVSVVCHFRI